MDVHTATTAARLALWEALEAAETYIADTARGSVLHEHVYSALLSHRPNTNELAWWDAVMQIVDTAQAVAVAAQGDPEATPTEGASLDELCRAVAHYERLVGPIKEQG
jgi:hypothetical protein